jgi:hypothetical protein
MMPKTNPKRVVFLIAVFAFAMPLSAQRDSASLEGRTVDGSGAVVPLASVDAVDLDTNFNYHTLSDSAGQWTISPVRIGRYRVTLTAAGFKAAVVGPITLDVQQRQRVDLTLVPGTVSQSVEVLTNSPLLQTDTSERGQVVDNKTMVGLPLNGRNPVQLAQLTVGVTTNEPGARTTAAFGFSASGSRSIDNSFLLDGVDNNSNLPDLLNEANYVVMPPPDALQEFKIETGNYDSEFGRSTGAIVNAVTRSGSNQFHGVLYEFLRNQNLDALNYYDTSLQPYHQNQFGATLGGPIVRNKVFFFGDYEGLRITHAQPITSLVPTAAQKAGDFSSQLDLSSPTGVADCNGVPTYQGELFDTTRTQTTASTASGSCGVPFGYQNGVPMNVIPTARMDALGAKLIQLFPAANVTAAGYNYLSDPLQTQVVNQPFPAARPRGWGRFLQRHSAVKRLQPFGKRVPCVFSPESERISLWLQPAICLQISGELQSKRLAGNRFPWDSLCRWNKKWRPAANDIQRLIHARQPHLSTCHRNPNHLQLRRHVYPHRRETDLEVRRRGSPGEIQLQRASFSARKPGLFYTVHG